MKKFYVIAVVLLICLTTESSSATRAKRKLHKTTTEATETNTSQPAIIAIEIVDPNENSTSSSKYSKRTIESSLGYGYNSFDGSKPRYEVYKYSQHDIPAYKGSPSQLSQSSFNNQVNVQKSVQYSISTAPQLVAASSNALQPGTTLYSSLSNKGQVGGLSASLPDVPSSEPVPVVVLRIYPNQLKDSTIQANLPKSNPFAKSINSINIQTLLLQYIKTLKNPGTLSQYSINHGSFGTNFGSNTQYTANQGSLEQSHGTNNQYYSNQGTFGQNHQSQYSKTQASLGQNRGSSNQYYTKPGLFEHKTYSSNQIYSTPFKSPVKPAETNYPTSTYYRPASYQPATKYQSSNGGNQNYMYYQQSFPKYSAQDGGQQQYSQQQYSGYDSGVTVQEAPIKYEINNYHDGNQFRYQSTASHKPQKSKISAPAPQPQYYYVQQNMPKSYSTESSIYYQSTPQLQYSKELVQTAVEPAEQQYYTGNDKNAQYSDYFQNVNQQYKAEDKLLTFENYPTPKHTRVVFRTKSGDVRTPEQEQVATKEVKTIQIHVPEDIAKVEVQETERSHYTSESEYSDDHETTKEQSADPYPRSEKLVAQNNFYLQPSDSDQQDYLSNQDSASENIYSFQNIKYDDMAKYFEKRGAMPKYFFQSPKDAENTKDEEDSITTATEDIVSVYEEAAFPASTVVPVKKKEKSKKRTQI